MPKHEILNAEGKQRLLSQYKVKDTQVIICFERTLNKDSDWQEERPILFYQLINIYIFYGAYCNHITVMIAYVDVTCVDLHLDGILFRSIRTCLIFIFNLSKSAPN